MRAGAAALRFLTPRRAAAAAAAAVVAILGMRGLSAANAYCFDPPPRTALACPAWLDLHYPSLAPDVVAAALDDRSALGVEDGSASRPWMDLVVAVPSVSGWTERRAVFRRQFRRTAALLPRGRTVTLIFVLGTRAYAGGPLPARPPDGDEPDIVYADCTDSDGPLGMWYPRTDSSTSCKVIAAMQLAIERWRFHYFARVGDDAYFRFDTFLSRVAPAHLRARQNLAFSFWMPGGVHTAPAVQAVSSGPPGFPAACWLPYAGGIGYVFSYNITRALGGAATLVGLADAAAEDVMTGYWLAALAPSPRIARVHSPCVHNHAEWVAMPAHVAGRAKYWLAAPCTPSSLMVHYMTPALWARVTDAGDLECGELDSAFYCQLPPFTWFNRLTA